jgi:ABC-type transporter Mla maintaining outer membrane lipid asymmetry ATPase subunit MlaF
MVFQSGALFDSLTVGENVGFLLYEHSDLPRDRIQVRHLTLCVLVYRAQLCSLTVGSVKCLLAEVQD